jgi:hypothetical protein
MSDDQYSINIQHESPEGDSIDFQTTVINNGGWHSLDSAFYDADFTYKGNRFHVLFDDNGTASKIRSTSEALMDRLYETSEIDGSRTDRLTEFGQEVLRACQEMVDDIFREPHVFLLRHTKRIQSVIDRHTTRRDAILDFLTESGIDPTMKG